MRKYLIYHLYHTISRGHKVSHIHKVKIKNINNFSYVNYKYNLNQPMQLIERRLNKNTAKNPQLINALNRGKDHPLIRKYTDIPFNH